MFTQADTRKHYIGVRAGTLDEPDLGKPEITIWTSSAPSWACFDPDLRAKAKGGPLTFGEQGEMKSIAVIASSRAPAPNDGKSSLWRGDRRRTSRRAGAR